jgi:membrane protease YdiL (CAAX protease family)
MKKISFYRIIVFYLIAFALSNTFRFDLFHLQETFDSLPIWTMIIYSPLQAVGVLLGALIAIWWLRKNTNTEISIWGTSKKGSIIMSLVPVVLLLILGVQNNQTTDPHYYGFMAGLSTLVYCLCEEFGWRGYLEEELKNLSEFKRVLIIAGLWYLWHLKFLINPDLVQNLIFFGLLIFGSWGLGKIIKITKSILAVSCFHLLINVLFLNGSTRNGLNSTDKIIVIGVLVPVWILILIKWKKEKTIVNK